MKNYFVRFISQYRYLVAVGLLLVLSAAIFLIWRGTQSPPPSKGITTIPLQGGGTVVTGGQSTSGGTIVQTSIRLSEGQPQPQAAIPVLLAEGQPLSDQQIQQLLARLPALPVDPETQVDFKLPTDPIPPPRPGQTIQQTFPAATVVAPPTVESGPLQVLRYSPEGEIPIAPFINITFNQPMVALTTVSALAAQKSPVQIEPPLAGTWRWLGTRTLNFQYDSALIDRLPKATSYRVTIPAGTTSATGGVLAKAVEWSFSTPPATLTTGFPNSSAESRTPLFFIHFDQRIDPAQVLKTIRVTASGQNASLALVSEADLKADKTYSYLLDGAKAGRWLAFRAQQPLPSDADVTVTVGPGTPSAEGPLVTKDAQTYTFHTYAALRIMDHGCSWGGDLCQPLTPFSINFNNPIDETTYTEAMLHIEPALPGAQVSIFGSTIQIEGATKGQTTYTVTVSGDIQDTFGQKLGQDQALTFQVGQADPVLSGPSGNFITLDPASKKPVFTVYTMNMTEIEVKIYAVQPEDWQAFKDYMRQDRGPRAQVQATPPGRLALNKTQPVESPADTLTEVNIDLASIMDGSFGHFIVIVSPPQSLVKSDPNRYWQDITAWVQVTQIGLDAFNDQSSLVVWTTALQNGAPLPDVAISAPLLGKIGTTGKDGTVRLDIPAGATYLVASLGADRAILPHDYYPWSDSQWEHSSISEELRWYVFDDRQMYRPGEEVHVKGWLRRISGGQDGDVGLVGSGLTSLNYEIFESQGNSLGKGQVAVNALGAFDLTFKLPDKVNLGYARLVLDLANNSG